jgi:hypothetical protein
MLNKLGWENERDGGGGGGVERGKEGKGCR